MPDRKDDPVALVQKCVPADRTPPMRTNSASMREAEARRKRARTLAKQQQAAECIAAAATQLVSGINEAASAAEQIAVGASLSSWSR